MKRREFLAAGAASLAAAPGSDALAARICLFTDHLGGFGYQEVARMLKVLKVSGPDLTVRRGGLVPPEAVAEELPKAHAVFREHGLSIPMITTTITSADPAAHAILTAASKLKIAYYKLGYFPYADLSRWQETIDSTRRKLGELAEWNRKLGLKAGMHNHAGDSVGCSVWDSWEAMQGVDPHVVGFYYDPAQAAIEGGKTGWRLAFRRAQSRLFMIGIKDFVWEKTDKGWRTRWVPLGQGMVNWDAFFPMLRQANWPGPISLHIEYDPGGSTKTERYDRSLEAAARDLQFLRARLETG